MNNRRNNATERNLCSNTLGGMKGTGGMNNTNGMNGRARRLEGDLLEQIRALSFVKNELELYLDTHPYCRTAIDYYHRTVEELERLMEEYHNTRGPLVATGVTSNDEWTWVGAPWPWQNEIMQWEGDN